MHQPYGTTGIRQIIWRRRGNYKVDSSDVFDRLMVLSLTKCKDVFHYHLLGKGFKKQGANTKKKGDNSELQKNDESYDISQENEELDPSKPINPKILERSDRWNDINPILFTFFKSTIHILSEAKVS